MDSNKEENIEPAGKEPEARKAIFFKSLIASTITAVSIFLALAIYIEYYTYRVHMYRLSNYSIDYGHYEFGGYLMGAVYIGVIIGALVGVINFGVFVVRKRVRFNWVQPVVITAIISIPFLCLIIFGIFAFD